MFLLRRLNKVANIVQTDEDYKAMSALLVDLMLKAKPFIPKEKLSYIYQEEPRQLLHARRVRSYKPKVGICYTCMAHLGASRHKLFVVNFLNSVWR